MNMNRMTTKAIMVLVLTLLLLIPLDLIDSLIEERKDRQVSANFEVRDQWGTEQSLTGPILRIPYRKHLEDNNGFLSKTFTAYFLPDTLSVTGTISPEIRYRGIYKIVVYQAVLNISGEFIKPDFATLEGDGIAVQWQAAVLEIGLENPRGIRQEPVLQLAGIDYKPIPTVLSSDLLSAGFHVPNLDWILETEETKIPFSITLKLQGSDRLNIIPVGTSTAVSLSSTWSNPSFDGAYLPVQRTITEQGFSAHWYVSYLNRNFPPQWKTESKRGVHQTIHTAFKNSNFGITLLVPVDFYQMSTRSTKYGILFLSLTFISIILFEVHYKLDIHPMQYLLVGLALCLFYLLLISLSEQVGFLLAYLIASGATISLIGAYIHSAVKKVTVTIINFLVTASLYGYLYILLQLQDYALLVGSIGLFMILALVMFLTRKINWYLLIATTVSFKNGKLSLGNEVNPG
ncbi:cell envelope integrity protein CreD [candidate division CSSED10-310 bacterium]|uniref:Cell envelope integrity protein CreD n=1 Tax=candidate division CSSED10-310 bacterium TaxID=2855610 RepID=A0ABV6YS31_UNCC1